MSKLGIYIATYENPLYLRCLFLQILSQSFQPNYVAVHQNGPSKSYKWVIDDLLDDWAPQTIYRHTQQNLPHPVFQAQPLRDLLEKTDATLFVKLDQDDIFMTGHLSNLVDNIGDYDCAVNQYADVVEMYPKMPVQRVRNIDWTWNPTGGASDGLIFTRKFAEKLDEVNFDKANLNTADDVLIGRVMSISNVNKYKSPSTMAYVSHGDNTSGPIKDNIVYQIEKAKKISL